MNTLLSLSVAWWAPLADEMIKVVAGVLGVVLLAVAMKVLAKLGIDTSASKNELAQRCVAQAVAYVEEWAHRQVSVHGGQAPSGDEKLSKASEVALRLMRENHIEAKSQAWVEERIHSALGMRRPSSATLLESAAPLRSNPPPA